MKQSAIKWPSFNRYKTAMLKHNHSTLWNGRADQKMDPWNNKTAKMESLRDISQQISAVNYVCYNTQSEVPDGFIHANAMIDNKI